MEWVQLIIDTLFNTDIVSFISYGIFGIGGSKQKSSSSASSSSADYSRTTQRMAFEESQRNLSNKAIASHLHNFNPNNISETATQLFSSGTKFLDSLGGGEGADFLRDRISGDSGIADQRINNLGEDLGRFFREELLTGISRNATASGTQGGSRQGVAESLAVREVAEQFQRGATEIRGSELDARTSAAKDLFALENEASTRGLEALPALQELSESSEFAELSGLQALRGILGDPTILTESYSKGKSHSTAYSKGKSSGFSLEF